MKAIRRNVRDEDGDRTMRRSSAAAARRTRLERGDLPVDLEMQLQDELYGEGQSLVFEGANRW